jgi:glycosyltransferase involved in cell wall biosynthesis
LAFRARPSKPHRKIQPSYGGYSPPPGWNPALPFFVTATSDEPRKNIGLIVRGFYEELRGRANVVILGEVNSNRYNPGVDANVYFPGYVTDAEKVRYFKNARGVLFASLAEGFGIPLIEGAVLELPVICSDIEVFREVAEDGAFYFDPHDSRSLATAVREVLVNPEGARRRAAALRRTVLARFSQEAVGAEVQAAFDHLGIVEKVSAVGVERPRFRSDSRASSALLGEGGGRI